MLSRENRVIRVLRTLTVLRFYYGRGEVLGYGNILEEGNSRLLWISILPVVRVLI